MVLCFLTILSRETRVRIADYDRLNTILSMKCLKIGYACLNIFLERIMSRQFDDDNNRVKRQPTIDSLNHINRINNVIAVNNKDERSGESLRDEVSLNNVIHARG